MMIRTLRLTTLWLLVMAWIISDVQAGHGHHRFGYPGYGFGANHHSFYSPGACGLYGSAWYGGYRSSFARWPGSCSFTSYRSCWPTYQFSYRPVFYYSSHNYCPPTYVAPINVYPATYFSLPAYNYWPTVPTWSVGWNAPTCSTTSIAPVTYSAGYGVPAVGTSLANTISARDLSLQVRNNYVTATPDTGRFVSTSGLATEKRVAASSEVPAELLQAADAILAAGGYRQAAQAYAQLALQFGNSKQLYSRRFIAQVAGGDYEQAAVIVNLLAVSKIQIDTADLPRGDLRSALGVNDNLIARRSEGLAANALVQPDDPIPLQTIATWLALAGDSARAELFHHRASQLRTAETSSKVSLSRFVKN